MTGSASRFVPASPAHVDGIITLMGDYYADEGYPFDEMRARSNVWRMITEPALGALQVACEGPRVIAYVAITFGFSFEYGGRDAFVDELVVAADHRGHGLGEEGLRVVDSICRSAGVRAVHLEVEREKGGAKRLYERAGFVEHGRFLLTKVVDTAAVAPVRVNRSMPAAPVIPVLYYPDVRAAVSWLQRAFGFAERLAIATHRAQMTWDTGAIVVAEARAAAPARASHSVMVRVSAVDPHCARAREAGADIVQEPTTFPYGERQYTAIDLAGHSWTFSESVEDVDPVTWGGEMRRGGT